MVNSTAMIEYGIPRKGVRLKNNTKAEVTNMGTFMFSIPHKPLVRANVLTRQLMAVGSSIRMESTF